jgi:hypothetical protein
MATTYTVFKLARGADRFMTFIIEGSRASVQVTDGREILDPETMTIQKARLHWKSHLALGWKPCD